MITTDSMVLSFGDMVTPIDELCVRENEVDQKTVWDFWFFNHLTDEETIIARLDPKTFVLEVFFAGKARTSIELTDGIEDWFLNDFSKLTNYTVDPYDLETMTNEEIAVLIKAYTPEDRLMHELIYVICQQQYDILDEEKYLFQKLEESAKTLD